MTTRYTIGSQVVVTGTYTTSTGSLIDPTDARVDIVAPTGVSTTYTYSGSEVTKVSTGIYTYTVDTTGKFGRWSYRFWSPNPGGAAGSGDFIVNPFPPSNI